MVQQLLWEDDRIPAAFLAHYEAHKRCLNCGAPLRHHLHAKNHWAKFHTKKVTVPDKRDPFLFFYVWDARCHKWREVRKALYDNCREAGFATMRSRVKLQASNNVVLGL